MIYGSQVWLPFYFLQNNARRRCLIRAHTSVRPYVAKVTKRGFQAAITASVTLGPVRKTDA